MLIMGCEKSLGGIADVARAAREEGLGGIREVFLGKVASLLPSGGRSDDHPN